MEISIQVKPIEILLIEDNPGDIRLAVEALKEGRVRNNLNYVLNGQLGLDFLYKKGEFKTSPTPDLILLDLNLPLVSGKEILQIIKTDDDLMHIPVIVLTSSEAEADIVKSYQLHANCYITKPLDMKQFFEVIHKIESFWFSIVKLPTKA
jgi:two-component system, chemotaxis family, response regulator Rcp1